MKFGEFLGGLTRLVLILVTPAMLATNEPPSAVVWAPPPPVHFAAGSSRLTRRSLETVALYARAAKSSPNVHLYVTGYADATGPAGANLSLSLRRALAVRAALVARGVPANQMTAVGAGETGPANVVNPAARQVAVQLTIRGTATFDDVPFGGGVRARLLVYLSDDHAGEVRVRVYRQSDNARLASRTFRLSDPLLLRSPHRLEIDDLAASAGLATYAGVARIEVALSPETRYWPVLSIEKDEIRLKRILPR